MALTKGTVDDRGERAVELAACEVDNGGRGDVDGGEADGDVDEGRGDVW